MQGVKLQTPKEVVDQLASRLSDTQAARQLGIAVSSFFLLRKRYGIESFTKRTGNRRSLEDGRLLLPGQGSCHPQHYRLKSNCFESIDSEEKAYYLGLLASDGHTRHTERDKYFAIELQDPDSIVLDGLKSLLGYDGAIDRLSREGKKDSSRLRVYSRELVESLISKGITLNTEEHYPATDLPSRLRGHYLRGLLDGDGHIKAKKGELFLCGCSRRLMGEVANWISEELGLQCVLRSKLLPSGKPFYKLRFGGNPRAVIAWAYQGDGPSIPRKREEARLWLAKHK